MTSIHPLHRTATCFLILILATGLRASDGHAAHEPAPPAPAPAPEHAPDPTPAHAAPSRAPAAAPVANLTAEPTAAQIEVKSLLTLGTNLTDRADYIAAEIAYRQILDRREFTTADKQQALLGLARMYRKQGIFVKSAAIYERFLKDNPDDARIPEIMLDLGRTLRAMGAHKLALNRFYSVINSTLKLNSDGFSQYQLLARTAQFEIAETLYEAGDFAEAGKFFLRLRLLDLAPVDRARAHFKAACAQRLNHDIEAAAITLRAYLEQWPDDENIPEARYLLASTLRQLNRLPEALAATLDLLQAEQARSGTDTRRWTYWQRRTGNQLANEFFQAGDTLNALAIYRGLAALAPEPAWRLPVVYQIALCYERLQQTDEARKAYENIRDTLAAPAAGPAPAAPAAPNPELIELARMAAWRLSQLDWRSQTDTRLQSYFETTTGRAPASRPIPTTTDDANGGTPATPAAL